MKASYLFAALSILTIVSCKSQKEQLTQVELDTFDKLVKSQQFRIESDWAYPLTTVALQRVLNSGILSPGSGGGSISLVGNSNFLKIYGDSISSYLPYFGERQMLVEYGGGNSGIEFKGLTDNYKAIKNKNNSYTITFEAKSNSEKFNVTIKLTPNLKSDIFLSSASRNAIRYSGEVDTINPKIIK